MIAATQSDCVAAFTAYKRKLRFSLFRLGDNPDVGVDLLEAIGIQLLSLFIGYGAGQDNVIAILPVRRGRHLVLRRQLHRIQHANDLVEVAARASSDRPASA